MRAVDALSAASSASTFDAEHRGLPARPAAVRRAAPSWVPPTRSTRCRRPLPRALPRPRDRALAPASRARTTPSLPCAAMRRADRAGHRQVRSQRAAARRPPRPRRRRRRRLGCGAPARATRCAAQGATIYVGDHVHDVEGARAAGAVARLRADRRPAPRDELAAAGTDVVLDDLTEFPAWLDEHLLDHPARGARGRPARARRRCWSPSAAAPTRRSCWLPRSGRSGPDNVVAATALLRLAARRPSATRPGRSPRRSASRLLTPQTHEIDREGYRAQRRRPLLLLQGRAARRARRRSPPSTGSPRVATGTNADDAVAGFRPGIRRRRRARRRHPAARRRAHQGAGPGGLPRAGSCRPGTSRPRPACRRGSPTASRSPRTGWRGSSAPRPPCGRVLAAGRDRGRATCGCATSATGPGSSSTPTLLPARRDADRRGRVLAPCARPGSTRPTSTRSGFRSGSMNELLPDPSGSAEPSASA